MVGSAAGKGKGCSHLTHAEARGVCTQCQEYTHARTFSLCTTIKHNLTHTHTQRHTLVDAEDRPAVMKES